MAAAIAALGVRRTSALALTLRACAKANAVRNVLVGCATSRWHATDPWGEVWQRRAVWTRGFAADAAKPEDAAKEEGDGEGAGADEEGDANAEATADDDAAPEDPRDAQIAALEAEKEELNDRVLRAYADVENLRTRMTNQVDAAKSFAIQGFAKDLLDGADNLERALAAVPEEVSDADAPGQLKGLAEGVAMTNDIMLKSFKNNGLERFDPTGEAFDPNTMMALFEIPASAGAGEPGTVAQTTKVGYLLNGRAIRPAEVGVVKAE